MAGYRFGGNFDSNIGVSLEIEESESYAIAADIDLDPERQIELFWSHQESELRTKSGLKLFELDTDYIHVGGLNLYPMKNNVTPFVAGGLGVTYFNPGGNLNSETRFSISLGGGIKYFPTKHFGVRLEGRGYVTWFPDSTGLFCSSGSGGGSCGVHLSGEALFQAEGLAGIVVRF